MPLLAIASAMLRTVASSMRLANLFQLFQPIGGVRARPLSATLCSAGRGLRGGSAPSPAGARTATISVGLSVGRRRVEIYQSPPTHFPSHRAFRSLLQSIID